jgi:CRISPR-associated protein Cmr4
VSENKARWNSALTRQNRLNLGWLMLEKDSDWSATDDLQVPQEIKSRIVLVSDKLFSQIVNSNLEVRTSVSIDPRTGAAAEGALFTYEALPRATWLWLDVVEDDYRNGFPASDPKAQQFQHKRPLDVVRAGLELAEYLGIGGMGTRGFGRVKLMAQWEV